MVCLEQAAKIIGCSLDVLRDAMWWGGIYDPIGSENMVYEYELQGARLEMHRRRLVGSVGTAP